MNNDQYKDVNQYVEDYYRNALNEEQKKQFEENISTDPEFAEKVAFYLSTIIAAKQLQQEETTERFKDLYKQKEESLIAVRFEKWRIYITSVAASIIIIAGSYYLFFRTTPEKLADNYVKENLMQLHQTLGITDSLHQGKDLFNKQQYDSAIKIFQGVYDNHPDNSEAKMNIGLTYLVKKSYNDALQQFDELGSMPGLYASHASFLKAITLMERNDEGDKERAKQLLQVVKQQKLYGAEKAEEWEIFF